MMFADEWLDLDVDSKRNSLCNSGKCEFLLTCWMASGFIESTCGGFLYVCCDRNSAKTNENIAINTNRASVPVDYGPVTNDPSKSLAGPRYYTIACITLYTHNITLFVVVICIHFFVDNINVYNAVTCKTSCAIILQYCGPFCKKKKKLHKLYYTITTIYYTYMLYEWRLNS